MSKDELITGLIEGGYLKTPLIIEAFRLVDRRDFVPEEIKHLAYLDEALPIGHGQTISQPLTVAFMLEALQPRPGDKILEIGTGSGWKTALLANLISANIISGDGVNHTPFSRSRKWCMVISIERIPELYQMAGRHIKKYNFLEKGIIKLILGDGSQGYPEEAPYDRIISGAAPAEVPSVWKKQLKIGGRLLTPLNNNTIVELNKTTANDFTEKVYPGFVFVPLVSDLHTS